MMAPQKSVIFGALLTSFLAVAGCSSSTDTPRTGFDTAPTDPGAAGGEPDSNIDQGNPAGTGEKPAAQPDRPGCAQDEYKETLPTKTSLSGVTFSSAKANDFLLAALDKRYPLGKKIIEGGLSSSIAAQQGNCIDRFLSDKSSAASVLRQSSTVVHECGHFFDLGKSKGADSGYVIRPAGLASGDKELSFVCKSGDTTSRGGKTFARSLIKKDAHYSDRVACDGKVKSGCDFYADIYLDGSASDTTFDSGDQGYSFVLEEATQYVNSLASALAFQEQYQGTKVSERDGILTFLWYIERYLAMARTDYPAAYKFLSEDSCWRQATLSVWDRGWFFLKATKGMSNLGMDDGALETLVTESVLTSEIDALRKLECTGN